MRKPEINFRKITKYYSFRLFQSMFRLEKDIKSGSPATAVIYYVSTSLISCLGFDSCFRAHHCSVITTHPCSSYYLHLCTESPSMAQTHCCPVSQFLFFFLHSFPAISVVPSLSSLSFTPFPFSVFWHFYFSGHCWFLSHPILFHNFTSFTPTFPVSSNVTSYLSPHSSLFFPFLFFSLSDNDTGKFTPVTLRMELPESCRWMLHGALDWCMRCNTRGLWCMMNTVNDARLGLFSWSRSLLKLFFFF